MGVPWAGLAYSITQKAKKTTPKRSKKRAFVKYHKMFIFMSEFGHIRKVLLCGIIYIYTDVSVL